MEGFVLKTGQVSVVLELSGAFRLFLCTYLLRAFKRRGLFIVDCLALPLWTVFRLTVAYIHEIQSKKLRSGETIAFS